MAAGVLDQGVRRVEAHGLGVQEPGAESRRVVVLQPATGIDEVGERHGVALWEPVVGEGSQLLPDLLGHVGHHPPATRPVQEPMVEGLHPIVASLGSHGLAEAVSLGGREAGHVDGQLHELLLEQRDAQGLGEGVLTQGMQVGDRLTAIPSPDVGMHRPSLDGARPDQGDLHHQVVEVAGA